jgi:hypothetical protein
MSPIVAPFAFPLPVFQRTQAFAGLIVAAEGERCQLNVSSRRAEITAAIVGAVADFLSVRISRFPRLASNLARRFAIDRLPGSTVRALRRTAVRAFVACFRPLPTARLVPT